MGTRLKGRSKSLAPKESDLPGDVGHTEFLKIGSQRFEKIIPCARQVVGQHPDTPAPVLRRVYQGLGRVQYVQMCKWVIALSRKIYLSTPNLVEK